MKYLSVLVLSLLFTYAGAQQFRLSYDPDAVPELYNTTTVFLEERTGGGYQPYEGRYRISANQGRLHRDHFSYTAEELETSGGQFSFTVQVEGRELPLSLTVPVLKEIRFNLYTDSIKPILNYYVNVEGVFSSGRIYPLTEAQVVLTADVGTVSGMEWIAPAGPASEKVVFTARSRTRPALTQSTTVYIKKQKDPRDMDGHEERSPIHKK